MEQVYSSLKKSILLFIFGSIGYAGFAQPCTAPLVQDFNNTGGTMAGFTSTIFLSTAPGFTYGSTGPNGYLQRCNIPTPGAEYLIYSPTYQTLTTQTTIPWGFTLRGDVEASKVEVFVQYIADPGTPAIAVSVYENSSTPYNGSGANRQLTVCETTPMNTLSAFNSGEPFRIVIKITAETASNNNQCIIFDDFRVGGTAAQAPLPVSFVGFGAKKIESGIELIWNVVGETDVLSYQVERSTNGRDFIKLGEVAASNSTAYSFMDKQPANGLAFYRIKEVDIDGKYKYSTIVRLNLDISFGLRAYPSPARDLVTIEHAVSSKGKLSITAADGRVVRQIDIKPDLSQTVVNVSGFKAGLYIVRFTNGNGQTETTKLIKE